MQFKNEAEVKAWLDETENADSLDEGDVREAFRVIYDRYPEADEDAFSLVCAGVA